MKNKMDIGEMRTMCGGAPSAAAAAATPHGCSPGPGRRVPCGRRWRPVGPRRRAAGPAPPGSSARRSPWPGRAPSAWWPRSASGSAGCVSRPSRRPVPVPEPFRPGQKRRQKESRISLTAVPVQQVGPKRTWNECLVPRFDSKRKPARSSLSTVACCWPSEFWITSSPSFLHESSQLPTVSRVPDPPGIWKKHQTWF